MAERGKFYLNVSTLITHARLQMGFATLKELYREREPAIDYQTWIHAESGRRVPKPSLLLMMGDILNIDREKLIMAYCKDKFADNKSLAILENIQRRNFFDVDALIDAKDHERTRDYIFSASQVQAMQQDMRLRLYLMYTYDDDCKTTFSRLATYFNVQLDEVAEVITKLQSLGLVEVIDEEVRKIYRHATLIATDDVIDLRKSLLLKSMELNVNSNSTFSNYSVSLSEESYKKFLGFTDFAIASLIKLEREDEKRANNQRFEIAIICNRLSDGSSNEGNQPAL